MAALFAVWQAHRQQDTRGLIDATLAERLPNKLELPVGYQSRSNFYTRFRKYCTDQTPNQYREQRLQALPADLTAETG